MSLNVKPAFETNNIAIVFQSSDYYAPYTSVTIQSIIDNISESNNYDIIVTSLDMTAENASILEKLSEQADNVSVRVTNVSDTHQKYPVVGNDRFGAETLTRVFLPEILTNYNKVISMDSDMIVTLPHFAVHINMAYPVISISFINSRNLEHIFETRKLRSYLI